MDHQTFHKYNRLVKRGLVRPLACPHCDTTYVLRATDEGEPRLQCLGCNSLITPGLETYRQVQAVVKEHFG